MIFFMIAIISLFIIIIISVIITRIASIALELTGIPKDVATFQAQSAFSGTGFTTTETEAIVNHPARRKIIRILIMLGSAGLTSSIATLIIAFVGQSGREVIDRGLVLLIGLLVVYLFARSELITKFMKQIITKILEKYTSLEVTDYNEILGLGKGYGIIKFTVIENSWLIGKAIKSLNIRQEGILILTIKRIVNGKEELIGAPTADIIIQSNDELVCYGKEEMIKNISERINDSTGDKEHHNNVNIEKTIANAEEKSM